MLTLFPVTASGGLTFSSATISSTTPFQFINTVTGSVTPVVPLPAALSLFATGLSALGLRLAQEAKALLEPSSNQIRRDRGEVVFLFDAVPEWPLADIGVCAANVRFWG